MASHGARHSKRSVRRSGRSCSARRERLLCLEAFKEAPEGLFEPFLAHSRSFSSRSGQLPMLDGVVSITFEAIS